MIVSRLLLYLSPVLMMGSFIAESQEDFSAGRQTHGFHSDLLRNNTASISFDKSFNTYHWNGIAFYQNTVGPVFLKINQQFLSTLIRTDRKLITDNQLFDAKAQYTLTKNLSVASNISSFILSDNKGIGSSIGEASSHAVYGGITYQPLEQVTIKPLVGIRFDKQIGQIDKGISYVFNINSDTLYVSDYASKIRGSFQYDKIHPRVLETHSASIGIDKDFFKQTRNHFQFEYYRNRRDFYQPADSAIKRQYNTTFNIESRSDNSFAIKDTLDYNVGKKMSWVFHSNIFSRKIDRTIRYRNIFDPSLSTPNTVINDLRIEGGIRGTYAFNQSLKSSFAFSYLERDEKHQVKQDQAMSSFLFDQRKRAEENKNNHARRTTFSSENQWCISTSDTIELSGSSNLLQYDTPNSDNDDDRDELWYLFSLSTHHRINQHLHLDLTLDASLIHLVYLFSSRSADNNWNRIIRLAPKFHYTPCKEFSSTNTFEVLANYTVYDYEYLSSLTKSYVFRQFAFIDSSVLAVTSRFGVDCFSHLRLYERGELRWSEFSERPANYFEEKTFFGNFHYILNDGLLFSVGIRYFSQLRFGYYGHERTLENNLQSIGPVTGIEAEIGRTRLSIRGWYESQSQTGQPKRGTATMTMSLNIRL